VVRVLEEHSLLVVREVVGPALLVVRREGVVGQGLAVWRAVAVSWGGAVGGWLVVMGQSCGVLHCTVLVLRQGSPSTVQLRSVLPLGPGPAVVEVVLVGHGHQLGLVADQADLAPHVLVHLAPPAALPQEAVDGLDLVPALGQRHFG